MSRTIPDPRDSPADFKSSWTLDMIAPLDGDGTPTTGLLFRRWSELTLDELPPTAQKIALDAPSWRAIAEALIAPEVVAAACDEFVAELDAQLRLPGGGGERVARFTLARAGLLSDDVPTLEQLGQEWGITRERVRQLIRQYRDIQPEAVRALGPRSQLRLVIAARFALHPGVPLSIDALADPETARGRTLTLALEASGLPSVADPYGTWTETDAQSRAFDALVDELPQLLPSSRSFVELKHLAAEGLPGIDNALDLDATLAFLSTRFDFGPGLDGRLTNGYAKLSQRVAEKIVTYLQRRAVPIAPADLAAVIRKGVPPFEPLHRPLIDAEWLFECARRNPSCLQLLPDGTIALARRLLHLRPSGNVGVLHSILVEHGEPMRMIDLCDRAAHFGMSRNQVGVFIHSGRAASLFMLTRGIVGLVGRDEGADPSAYKAATPGAKARVRIGEEVGFDSAGRLAVDIEVRRSIREQGFGLPWPFNVLYFSDHPKLEVDGQPCPINLRANGDLDLPQLIAGERVRLRLDTRRGGHLLSIETASSDPINPVLETAIGAAIRAGLPDHDDRPGWVDVVLRRAGTHQTRLEDVLRLLPRALPPRRRLAALYAFVALGLLQPSRGKWATRPERALSDELALAFAALRDDPLAYPVLPKEQQRAVAWLVRASWLVHNLGWSRVRPNDLADTGLDDDADLDTAPAATNLRETTLMRIVEAAHHAADLHRNPASTDTIDATSQVARRYLTALGYTAFNGIREADGLGPDVLSIHQTTDGPATALWVLLPLGSGVGDNDVRRARKLGRDQGVSVVVTDGVSLAPVERNGGPPIDLRSVGKKVKEFERVVSLAADPETLLPDG